LANAAFVGANTVYGAEPSSTLRRLAAVSAAKSVDSSGVDAASAAIVVVGVAVVVGGGVVSVVADGDIDGVSAVTVAVVDVIVGDVVIVVIVVAIGVSVVAVVVVVGGVVAVVVVVIIVCAVASLTQRSKRTAIAQSRWRSEAAVGAFIVSRTVRVKSIWELCVVAQLCRTVLLSA
jgi:hypothetical protein